MANTYKISSVAQQELRKSAKWYDKQLTGLGLAFADSIYAAADHICKHPESYSFKKKQFREFVVKRFPFVVVYEYIEVEELINILHVFHTSRNSKLKYRK